MERQCGRKGRGAEHDYDFVARIYDPVLYFAIKPIRKALSDMLAEYGEKSILDLCCGTGNQLKLLSKNGFVDLHGLDISAPMLEVAKKGNFRIDFQCKDATKTGLDGESFDIAIISFAIHEKDRDTQARFIEEAHRLIKKDGLLFVADYVFDKKTPLSAKVGISIIEKIAGKEHYNNFKNYIENDGLSSIVKKDKFQLIDNHRMSLGGVTISKYRRL